jgi:hypothetical protein
MKICPHPLEIKKIKKAYPQLILLILTWINLWFEIDLAKPNKVEEGNIFNQSLDTKALLIYLTELPL